MAKKLLIIAGPTASGKTGIAVDLALAYGAEVVSADSMQVYRGLNIGTAKPQAEDLRGVPHHLLDIIEPDQPFDVDRFVQAADQAIADIRRRSKRVIVAGGTGLYLRALLHGLQKGPKPDPILRRQLTERADKEGWPSLHQALGALDEETALRLHPHDGVRILRALEVVLASGIPLSEWHRRHQFLEVRYEPLFLVLSRPRAELNERIETRVDRMMADGFLEEVRGLIERGVGPELKPMQGLGYRRLCQHLNGELTLEQAVAQIKVDTRRFAKRQLTWLRKEPDIHWTAPSIATIGEMAARFFDESAV